MHRAIDTTDLQDTTAAPALPVLPLVLPMALGLATIAAGSLLATHPIDPVSVEIHLSSGTLTTLAAGGLAAAGLYAASLWHRARRAALRLEQAPKPGDAPRRRALYGSQAVRPQTVRCGAVSVLRADFEAVADANPTRRLEDKIAFLRRVAKRCRSAAIALGSVAVVVLLAA